MTEKTTDMTNDKWINIEEAAEYLGVKPATIRDWIRKGKDIPCLFGGFIYSGLCGLVFEGAGSSRIVEF